MEAALLGVAGCRRSCRPPGWPSCPSRLGARTGLDHVLRLGLSGAHPAFCVQQLANSLLAGVTFELYCHSESGKQARLYILFLQ